MNLGILANTGGWHYQDLSRAADELDYQLTLLDYADLGAVILEDRVSSRFDGRHDSKQTIVNLASLDGILVRPMPPGSLEQVVFRMDMLHQVGSQLQIPVVNPARTIECSVDKYLCLERIRGGQVRVPTTLTCESLSTGMDYFRKLDNDAVVKPLFGSGGRGICRIQNADRAEAVFQQMIQAGQVIYLQQYIEHGDWDIRLLVIGRNVMAMRRTNPGNWITNVQQGAIASSHQPTHQEMEIAWAVADRLDASLVGIDVVYDQMQQPYVVEANACPSWRGISDCNLSDISKLILSLFA